MKKLVMMAAMMLLGSSGAWALGTDANVTVSNQATLSFSAGGALQNPVTSTTDTFVVDRKIDMVLVTTDGDQKPGAFGETNVLTGFTFTNEGNADQNFTLKVRDLGNTEVAEYDADQDNQDVVAFTNITCTDTGGTVYSENGDTITLDAPEDEVYTCTVSATMPSAGVGVSNGQIMNIELNATAVDATAAHAPLVQNTGAEDQHAVDIVFADGVVNAASSSSLGGGQTGIDREHDGSDLARSGYIIKTPLLDATKLSCVFQDPVNGNINPKRIPGATIVYVFDINNTGTLDATDVNLTDDFSDDLTTATLKRVWKDTTANCECNDGENNGDAAVAGGGSDDTVNIGSSTVVATNVMDLTDINITAQTHTCIAVEADIK